MRMLRLAPLLLLALSSVAHAAPGDAAPVESAMVVVGRVLTKAKESGALARVLGERSYLLDDRDEKVVVFVRARLEDGALVSEVGFQEVGGDGSMATAVTVGLGGDIRRLHITGKEHEGEFEGNFEMKDGKLVGEISANQGGEKHAEEQTVELAPDAVPFSIACFVLPALFDQGLPATLSMRLPDKAIECLATEPGPVSVLTVLAEPETTPAGAVRVVRLTREAKESVVRVLADGAHLGELTAIAIDGDVALKPLTKEEADRLLAPAPDKR